MANPKLAKSRRQVREAVNLLIRKGLYDPKRPLRETGGPTEYARKLTRKLADVVSGDAAAVKVPRFVAKAYQENYRVQRGKVVVPVDTLAPKVRFSKKKNIIERVGEDVTIPVRPKGRMTTGRLPDLKPGEFYIVPFKRGRKTDSLTFSNKEDLREIINRYDARKSGTYQNMLSYVQIGRVTEKRKRARPS